MKVVIVGDTQVGKTCLLSRLTTGQFQGTDQPTIGAGFQNLAITAAHGVVSLQIWDTAGQEQYRSLAPMYYRNAQAAILVFDLTNHRSFLGLEDWVAELEAREADDRVKLFVVGNKCDLAQDRVLDRAKAERFAQSHHALAYYETSAKTGDGVIELFTEVADSATVKKQALTELAQGPVPAQNGECLC
jgi:small GTP-binding protein